MVILLCPFAPPVAAVIVCLSDDSLYSGQFVGADRHGQAGCHMGLLLHARARHDRDVHSGQESARIGHQIAAERLIPSLVHLLQLALKS